MKFKNIFLVLFVVIMASCQNDDESLFDFNYQRQYDVEKIQIDTYLANRYYDETTDLFQNLVEGETALVEDSLLKKIEVNFNEVIYEMYYYETEVGSIDLSPDNNDIVNAVLLILNVDNREINSNESSDGTFLDLTQQIIGLREGLTFFKTGISNETDLTKSREYSNFGKGFLIIPSGLTFVNEGGDLNTERLSRQTLIYRVGLRGVTPVPNTNL